MVKLGAGLLTVKVTALEVPPPGAGFVTVIARGPAVTTSAAVRTMEMDAAVYAAVADAVGRSEKILLQAMDASKLGWRAPSAATAGGSANRQPAG